MLDRLREALLHLWRAATNVKTLIEWLIFAGALGVPGVSAAIAFYYGQTFDVIFLYLLAGIAFWYVIKEQLRTELDTSPSTRKETRSHDVDLFRRHDATVNEPFLDHLLNGSLYHHWCRLDEIRAVRHFCEDLQREEGQFLDRKVREAALEAVRALAVVDAFVAQNFFTSRVEHDTTTMLQLYPEWPDADDERRTAYRRYASELNTLTEAAWVVYKKYRATVKHRLHV